MSSVVSMKALLESGVHFGHRTNKWDPHMRPYIFTERNGIHIIDLQQTVKALNAAYNLVRDTVANGGVVLFIGTKRQAQETVKEEAERCGMPYVTERWLGGMLTNWSTMFARITELDRLEKLRETGEINRLTKKEGLLIGREVTRLIIRLSGVRKMKRIPELVFVVDIDREETAIKEANKTGIPVIAMVDTNCNPSGVDYVIPSNDDAIRAIKLMVAKIADAVIEGKSMSDKEAEDEVVAAVSLSTGIRPSTDMEPELEDKDLFGDATLAKLHTAKSTVSPEETEAPAEKAAASTEVVEAPAEKAEVSVEETAVPTKKAKTADKVTEVPVEEIAVPAKKAKTADKVTEVPVEEIVAPAKKTKTADKVTEAPVEEIVAPAKKTKAADKVTEAPVEETVAPAKKAKAAPKATEAPAGKAEASTDETAA